MHQLPSKGWPAPAKLNLFLHVLGRRSDGYHTLQTAFQFLDYCDTLDFTCRMDGQINRVNDIPGVPAEQDLVVRAARLLQQYCGCEFGVDIAVHKRIPMGGGLGGGSSNAATTLVALDRLWDLGLPQQVLAEIGLRLGADVPVFLFGHAAWAEGVGENLTAVNLPEPWFLVISPPCHVSTAEIFTAPELTRDSKSIKLCDFLAGTGENVCEPVVCNRYPVIAQALDWLEQYAPARMTGTGACVFAAFEQESEALGALEKLPQSWTGFVARGLNRSPLLNR